MSVIIQSAVANALMQPWWSAWMAQKWGFADHCCHLWAATGLVTPAAWKAAFSGRIPAPIETIIVYREYLTEGEAESELANRIVDMTPAAERSCIRRFFLGSESLNRQAKSPTANGVRDIQGDILMRNGLPRPMPADEHRVDGWRFMYSCLRQAQMVEMEGVSPLRIKEGPMLLISSDCPNVIENVPLASRADKDQNDIEFRPEVEWDAVVNCLRYLLKGKPPARTAAPSSVRRQELSRSVQDPTSRHMAITHFNEMERRKQRRSRPNWRAAV